MDPRANLKHWEAWATQFGGELRATTKCVSIKRLEIEALHRRIAELGTGSDIRVLEIGCGNGVNGFALAPRIPNMKYVGLDFSPAMIENAAKTCAANAGDSTDRLAFGVGDLRALGTSVSIESNKPRFVGAKSGATDSMSGFDVVFTDRVIINLESAQEQLDALRRMLALVRPGGRLLVLENSKQTHAKLNGARTALGLPERPAASYNVFIDEPTVIDTFRKEATLDTVDDFGGVHDLMLYAVLPAIGNGEIEYDGPVMTKLTEALIALGNDMPVGPSGQNRLWVFRK